MQKLIEQNLSEIKNLMINHQVEKAYVFGSAAKTEMKEKSDVDFLIIFSKNTNLNTYAANYFDLMYALQDLLNCEVDLVEEKTISNPYLLKSINESKLLLL
jgi:predicted nucleotidyltransferase